MNQADDLEAIAEYLDQKAEESGDDSSFLRRALGKALLDRKQSIPAESQLRIALELQPQDKESWEWLIESLDQQQRPDDAMIALIDQSDTDARRLELYRDLHDRWSHLGQTADAERAATSMVEVAAEQSANHAALAELRENRKQWSPAIVHWHRAADLRREDPEPLLRLAAAQIHHADTIGALRTLNRLTMTEWDNRFEDVPKRLRQLRRKLRE